MDDAKEKHPVTPGAILPAREQLGDPKAALSEFEASLARAPRRFAGLYGAAHAAMLAGEATKARTYYAQLLELAPNGDSGREELREAETALAELSAR